MDAGPIVPPPPALGAWDWQPRTRRRSTHVPSCATAAHADAAQTHVAEIQKEQRIKRMLLEFKTIRCTSERRPVATHDHRCCPFFHSERDRRRPVFYLDGDGGPVDYCYVAEPCTESFDDPKTVCPRGDACTLSHSTAELLY